MSHSVGNPEDRFSCVMAQILYNVMSCRHTGASTASRKSIQGASVMKSKYGKAGGTTYNSSRTNIPLSASKTRQDKQAEKPPRAPVQVWFETSLFI